MIAKRLLPALAAISSAAAQSATCTVSTTTINSQADATGLASCDTVAGSIEIGPQCGAQIDISGPSTITGDLTASNNPTLITLKSTTLTTIGGTFALENVTQVQSLELGSISSVDTIIWQGVPQLQTLSFGDGITMASEFTVSDSFLSSLEGISLQTAGSIDINNNNRLTQIDLDLANLTKTLNIQANGQSVSVSLPNLKWINSMSISNVTTFDAPSLQTVNGSMAFDSNYFTSFNAPNLTSTSTGDISFVDNGFLGNISLPLVTSVGGGILIANNTALGAINGFPALTQVGGAIKLRGNFTDIEFPKLDVVKGAFDASSTADITSSCDALEKLAPTNQNGNNDIQGVFLCTSNNSTANSDTGTGTSSTGNSGGSSGTDSGSGSSNNGSMAAGLSVNHALLGLVAVGGFAQALW